MGESISLATVCSPMALKAMIRSPQVALGEFFLAKHQTFQPCVGLLLDKNLVFYEDRTLQCLVVGQAYASQ